MLIHNYSNAVAVMIVNYVAYVHVPPSSRSTYHKAKLGSCASRSCDTCLNGAFCAAIDIVCLAWLTIAQRENVSSIMSSNTEK